MCCHFFGQRYAAPSRGDFRCRPSPPKACGLSLRNGFLLTLQRELKYPFIKRRKKSNLALLQFVLLSQFISHFLSPTPFNPITQNQSYLPFMSPSFNSPFLSPIILSPLTFYPISQKPVSLPFISPSFNSPFLSPLIVFNICDPTFCLP